MDSPGPWLVSQHNPNTVINFFHHSGAGRYGSQPPLIHHGGYPVAHCFNPLTAFQISKFPEFVRALALVGDNEELMMNIAEIDPQIARIVKQTLDNFGTRDFTPRSYKMLNHPKVLPINPQIGRQFDEAMDQTGLHQTLALYRRFWNEHPWKEDAGRWG
jgi:hypothetical protein